MKKVDNFSKCLTVLKTANFDIAYEDEIYRTGVIGQFNLTFELAWKALQAVMRENGSLEAESGSPQEIIQLGYKQGYIDDALCWSEMLKSRNLAAHVYNEDDADSLLVLIRDSFIASFDKLLVVLKAKTEN